MGQVEVDLSGANRTLSQLLRGLRDGTDLASLIGEELTQRVDDRFRNEVDPDGSPWAALDPDYVAWKQRNRFIPKILQMRGDLRGKVAYKPYSDRVEVGVDLIYARRQHELRPFLFREDGSLGAADEAAVEAIAEDYLQRLADG